MFMVLTAKDSRVNVDGEAFGNSDWNSNSAFNTSTFSGIIGNDSVTVLFKPLAGMLSQPKYLPLRYCPLTIELELVNDMDSPIVSTFPGGGGTAFAADNTSLVWEIQNVQAKCDICVLDNTLDNSYAEHLLSGKPLPINYSTYVSQLQTLLSGANGQQEPRLNVTRALSRLKSVFVTLDKPVTDSIRYKDWNSFYSPMETYSSGINSSSYNGEIEFQVQLGSKMYPEYPIRSHAEAFYQLRKH